MATTNYAKVKDSDLIIQFSPAQLEEMFEKLPPGFYEPNLISNPMSKTLTFRPIKPKNKLVKFTGGPIADSVGKIANFLSEKTIQVYKELNIAHKIGLVFYGPHGTGKTCAAYLAMNELIEKHGAVCFDLTGKRVSFIEEVIEQVRLKQDSPIVIFIDEADYSFRHEEQEFLTFLDGENKHEQIIVLGCTNKLEKISARIKDRKSRIKHCIEIKSFPQEVYAEYVKDKMPSATSEEISAFSFLSEENGLSLDELKHAIIDYKIEGLAIAEAIRNSKQVSESEKKES